MLEGIRVIELGGFITAPLAAMMLADLGADVIKIEPPDGDSFRRGHGSLYGSTFIAYNRNKRSGGLDPNDGEAARKLEKPGGGRGVLVDYFRPGALVKLGLE